MGSLHEFLNKFSTHLFHIQHKVFRANHYAQGIIALYRMGASNARLLQFTNWYLPHLEDSNNFIVPNSSQDVVNLEKLRGQHKMFPIIRDHYTAKLKGDYQGDLGELIRQEFPRLADGLASSAFHGTIHTGYGFSVGSDIVACEGLAYLFHSYQPLLVSNDGMLRDLQWKGEETLDKILERAREDKDMQKTIEKAGSEEHQWGAFQGCMNALFKNHSDRLIDFSLQKKLNFDSVDQLRTLLVDTAVAIYGSSLARNDFFLLHGVTSGWALYELFPLFQDEEQAIRIARIYMSCLLATYLTCGAPPLDWTLLDNPAAKNIDWEHIIERTMDHNRDEHVLKLVQCSYDLAIDQPEKTDFYKAAALVALDHKLDYGH